MAFLTKNSQISGWIRRLRYRTRRYLDDFHNLNSSSIEAAALLYSLFILDERFSTLYSGYVHDDSRFVWNFLADRTSIPKENTSSVCSQNCDDKSEVCIRVETGKGTCIISTTSLPGTFRHTQQD
ncbi:nicastrin-like isoform X2 [Cucurbita moschata]|uniref:Nicastrin-like isoform X2 n=1 Tax=Cucurbita moschata TaxID=3662 RepID=A0A6J1F740_CUCMO|nr:nicastrin-like isoform X2 [Cucurbita moschata]XP_022934239.1 nicastrin-like isoform X2 [Cucurbita moschata]